ncbi:glutathione S-transferase family protein [Aestuariispira insulae]|uniref:Glutathione S-transferase n=1 Tax=Aestuariispira insulae TaxID=1461337 RepID=A0A3D9HWW1_9PROT|nr:glutathione S-transferase [Aestuariispira insulae]RED53977.1 glutathione S-transferase [Aestuariispira insulae]
MAEKLKIYEHPLSGHAHRVVLFTGLVGIEHERITIDLLAGEHKQDPYLTVNPTGQVPAIRDGDVILSDSNAILVYLARSYAPDWLPDDPLTMARIQRYLSLAAGELRNGPAQARIANLFGLEIDREKASETAIWLFCLLEEELKDRTWLVQERPTIADVALYGYIAHAPEGGIAIDPYPAMCQWLKRVEALPGFTPIPASKIGLAA